MTNSIAATIVVLVIGLLVLDATVLHWNVPVVFGRSFVHFVEWVSFWR